MLNAISQELIHDAIARSSAKSLSTASIREIVGIVQYLQKHSDISFLRMDMGVPGLPTSPIGIQAEINALKAGKSSSYANIDGIPELKKELSRFAKNFLDIETPATNCIVTAGAMMGSMIVFLIAARREENRQGVLFIDPGFAVQKRQAQVLNLSQTSFNIFPFRGKKLYRKLREVCIKENISVIIYSNPNNPTWICLTETELAAIGKVANELDIIIAEDLAYFGMDFRYDYSKPGLPPYQPTVAKYTSNYIVLISSSKAFSYAGQRVGAMLVSDYIWNREYPNLLKFGDNDHLGFALVQDGVYLLSAGTSHTAQYGLCAMLKAANDGDFNFLQDVHVYAERAKFMKFLFIKYGFRLVYDNDDQADLADGFYFTLAYPKLTNEQLIYNLLRCGISCISLKIMGSTEANGVRISVSMVGIDQYDEMGKRLQIFKSLVGI